MTDHLPGLHEATRISECLLVAHYLESHAPKEAAWQSNEAHRYFAKLAEQFGYRIEKIEADAAETVAKFGHHPEPATDFCVEVEAIEGEWFNVQVGFENGTPSKDELMKRVDAAMAFRVGGDLNAIKAKALLREIDKGMKAGPSSAPRNTPSIRPGLSDAGVPV